MEGVMTFAPTSNQQAPAGPAGTSWSETAYEWLQRSKRKKAEQEIAKDPYTAAWRFFQPFSKSGGTGIAFLDAALRCQTPDRIPVVDIRGGDGCGKTWTIITLAARFVVATRPSKFELETSSDPLLQPLPRVILLDSTYEVTTSKLAYAVRSTLLLQSQSNAEQFQRDMDCCLRRILISTASDVNDWIAILESIRIQLTPDSENVTLVLWDGFLSEPATEGKRMEVIRQVNRLLQDCSVLFVSTAASSTRRRHDWEKYTTHRIRLDRQTESSGHEYVATFHGSRVPFSISLAGILS